MVLFFVYLMLNLSVIKEIVENYMSDNTITKKENKWRFIYLVLTPVLVIAVLISVLFLNIYISEKKCEKQLLLSSYDIIKIYTNQLVDVSNYSFTKEWIDEAESISSLFERVDQNIASVSIIVKDVLNNSSNIYLSFQKGGSKYLSDHDDFLTWWRYRQEYASEDYVPIKNNYIYSSSIKERKYLDKVFIDDNKKHFIAKDGELRKLKLFMPFENNGKTIAILFSSNYY
jgi:hypothetical protein